MNYQRCDDIIMYKTTDYSIFRNVLGNRQVRPERVKKILDSIHKIGAQPIPLIVNEHFEIIDGQGRLEALRQENLPVYFIIREGLTIDSCITMNINSTPWNTMDYIECYADLNIPSFIRYLELYNKYHNKNKAYNHMTTNILSTACYKTFKAPCKIIRSGQLRLTEEMKKVADKRLEYAWQIAEWVDENKIKLNGRVSILLQSLMFCYDYDIDRDTLIKVVKERYSMMDPFNGVDTCIEQLDKIYNYNRKIKKVKLKRAFEDDNSKMTEMEIRDCSLSNRNKEE